MKPDLALGPRLRRHDRPSVRKTLASRIVRHAATYRARLTLYYRERGFYPFLYVLIPLALFGLNAFVMIREMAGTDPTVVLARIAFGATVGVFVTLLHLPSHWSSDFHRVRSIFAQCLPLTAAMFVEPRMIWFFWLPLYSAARLRNLRHAVVGMTAVTLVTVGSLELSRILNSDIGLGSTWAVLAFFAFVGWCTRLDVVRENLLVQLRLAQAETRRLAASAERERIARDLHDLLGHSLSVIAVKSELVEKLAAVNPERAALENADVIRISRSALSEVRQAVNAYRALRLDDEIAGADVALRSVDTRLELRVDRVDLTDDQEAALAFALREAVTNVVRHAGASRCQVELRREGRFVALYVRDDGTGSGHAADGNGLRGMRERIEALGGDVERHDVDGTALRVVLPLTGTRAAISELA